MSNRRFLIPVNIQRRLTKVFVTNLPEKCSGNVLSDSIRTYGNIHDLYIARKRDREGNRLALFLF
ncbi:putative RNA-binding domain superfamily [Helianthus anomalus]